MNKLRTLTGAASIFSMLALLSACEGCKPNTASPKPDLLLGQWSIRKGFREGAETSMFEGAYMRFEDGKMTTNLPIPGPGFEDVPTPYELKDDILAQLPTGTEGVEMKVVELTDSLLALELELRNTAFKFVFARPGQMPNDSVPLAVPIGQ